MRPLTSLGPFAECLHFLEGQFEASHQDYRIRSAFQPIYSFAHGRPVGFEGLARARDRSGLSISPMTLLASERTRDGTIFLDRLLRALHVSNFAEWSSDSAWLFLNVAPVVVVNGRTMGPFFKELLSAFRVPPERVVVEVTENETNDEGVLEESAQYYKDMGCLLAIDDFGAGHSNFHRIWRLRPDIIKLDRLMVSQAVDDPVARRGLMAIAGLLHEIGALVLAEGIETEQEALVAIQAEVDLLQGFLLQRPVVGPPLEEKPELFAGIRESLSRMAHDDGADSHLTIRPVLALFARAAEHLGAGEDLPTAVADLLRDPRVIRCYVLDSRGTQVGENLAAPHSVARRDPRHVPLGTAKGANWMHRHYFRRAIAQAGRTQVSRPYLSLTDPRMCITLSQLVVRPDQSDVLCCDVEYGSLERPPLEGSDLRIAARAEGIAPPLSGTRGSRAPGDGTSRPTR
jgi:EAL domain-containing protein (putative c-di-GMP-specific phosphodiesterase class I)